MIIIELKYNIPSSSHLCSDFVVLCKTLERQWETNQHNGHFYSRTDVFLESFSVFSLSTTRPTFLY